jgi:26S proteasome regulatory subunit N1
LLHYQYIHQFFTITIVRPNGRGGAAAPADSARANLASSFVNCFVNAGCCKDKVMTEEGSNWVFKNKDHGMMSAAASLGMVCILTIESFRIKLLK